MGGGAQVKAKERLNSQLTGPKAFPLERMFAIFYNIVDVSVLYHQFSPGVKGPSMIALFRQCCGSRLFFSRIRILLISLIWIRILLFN